MYHQPVYSQNVYQPSVSSSIHGDVRSRGPLRLNRLGTQGNGTNSNRDHAGISHAQDSIPITSGNTLEYENMDTNEKVGSRHGSRVLSSRGHSMEELAPVKIPQIARLSALGPPISSTLTVPQQLQSQGSVYGPSLSSTSTAASSKDLLSVNQRHRLSSRHGTANSNLNNTTGLNSLSSNKRNKSKSSYDQFFVSENTDNALHSSGNSNASHNSNRHSAGSNASPSSTVVNAFLSYPLQNETAANPTLSLPSISGASMNTTMAGSKRILLNTSSTSNIHAPMQTTSTQLNNSISTPSIPILPVPSSSGGLGLGTLSTVTTASSNIPSSATQNQRDLSSFFHEEHNSSSCSSMRGSKPGNPNWINQDNFFISEPSTTSSSSTNNNNSSGKDYNYYCILDGHGENGHLVSRRCRENFLHYLKTTSHDMRRAFALMQNDLSMNHDFDTRCSGATCVMVMIYGQTIIIANCGDSRAVLGKRLSSGVYQAVTLSNDHKPDKPEERKRILNVGGHVGCRQVLVHQPGKGPVSMPVGPCRVWYQHRGETLGLAMSRSLGDSVVHKCGVTAEPELTETSAHDDDEFIILATDGIWDVVDSTQAVQIVGSIVAKNLSNGQGKGGWSTTEASDTLVRLARSRWEKMSPMVDDITAIVVKLTNR